MIWTNEVRFQEKAPHLPGNMQSWLVLPQNLTHTIEQTKAMYALKRLSQQMEAPHADEQLRLQKEGFDARLALVRIVLLFGDGIPFIYARVIVPQSTYQEYHSILDNLGDSPIGNTLLFGDPSIQRSAFEFACIQPKDPYYKELQDIKPHEGDYWARRSLFHLPKGVLLITEVFSSQLPAYPFSTGLAT